MTSCAHALRLEPSIASDGERVGVFCVAASLAYVRIPWWHLWCYFATTSAPCCVRPNQGPTNMALFFFPLEIDHSLGSRQLPAMESWLQS